jgi:hypothetical protein
LRFKKKKKTGTKVERGLLGRGIRPEEGEWSEG